MAERRVNGGSQIDALYQWISYDLKRMRADLVKEMQISSAQVGALYDEIKADNEKASDEIAKEIRYGYKQNQSVYDGLSSLVQEGVVSKLDAIEENVSSAEKLEALLGEIGELKESAKALQETCDGVAPKIDGLSEKLEKLDELAALLKDLAEKFDLSAVESQLADVNAKLADGCGVTEEDLAKIAEKTEESVTVHSQKVLEAVAAIPVAENVDYTRIVDEVGDKMLELLNEIRASVPDADKIIEGTTEKVVESLPYPEKLDYDYLANLVAEKMSAKLTAPEVDYERLADLVVEKMTAKTQQTYDVVIDESGVNAIAEKVAEKVGESTLAESIAEKVDVESIDYDKVCLAAQAAQILPDAVDYDRIGDILESKLSNESYDLVIDEEGVKAIAKGVADELGCVEVEVIPEETPVAEEPEIVEEPAPVEETPVVEELAVAADEPIFDGDQMVDAETGLVVRLKKSFTAKMKQSDDVVKGYYSELKNALTSYKRINSNISWHGDRFNFGRDTVAKMTIVGKTLNLYLALDPKEPEFKPTVYHQKDVALQKAYESTPFLVKIKSDAALKKAVRLVAALAEKLATEKETNFEPVNYADEFAYESTKALFEAGFIKATKEKKVDLNNI